jgi:hypothetical protein
VHNPTETVSISAPPEMILVNNWFAVPMALWFKVQNALLTCTSCRGVQLKTDPQTAI